jgi:hypothetical protein
VSHRRRAQLREEIVGLYTLFQQVGAERLLAAMAYATERSAYGVDSLRALIDLTERTTPATWPALLAPPPAAVWPPPPSTVRPSTAAASTDTPTNTPTATLTARRPGLPPSGSPGLPLEVPSQAEVDRALDVYERYVHVERGQSAPPDHAPPERGRPGVTAAVTAATSAPVRVVVVS